jgi:predicted Zn-dependent protease
MVDLLAARLKRARGDLAGTRDLLAAAESRNRNYAPVAYALVDALQALSQHKDALREVDELLRSHPRDPRLYGMRARSLGALGQQLGEHQALAEQYYLMGTLPAAIEQLQLAQQSGQGDFYQLSVVEARLRQLRSELGEQRKLR